ncbi:MAG: hypothetical protein KAI50_10725 [Desulfobacterales bacterium]|nr:hypothetical protein [Desulfobacterales bacterium]
MKKAGILICCVSLLFAFSGCKSVGTPMPDQSLAECTFPDDGITPAPLWICDAPVEGVGVSAVGSAQPTKAGYNFQKDMAAAHGREQLAAQMKIKVGKMIKRYAETTGSGDSETVDKVNVSVSKLITSETLVGSRIFRSLANPNTKVLYVLTGFDAAAMQNNVQDAVKTSMRNNQALWQKFQAQKAQDELAAEISKMETE